MAQGARHSDLVHGDTAVTPNGMGTYDSRSTSVGGSALVRSADKDPANFTYPNSVHIAQVEVDADTGEVTIQRYTAVDDVGQVINP